MKKNHDIKKLEFDIKLPNYSLLQLLSMLNTALLN